MGENKSGYDRRIWSMVLIVPAILLLILLFYVVKSATESEEQLIPFTIIPIILGIIFELRRLNSSWKSIIIEILAALGFSLIVALITAKNEHGFSFDGQINFLPYVFIFSFTCAAIITYVIKGEGEKLAQNLTEGIVFLQSLAIIYFVIDFVDVREMDVLIIILLAIGFSFCLFSFYFAFTKTEHSDTVKFVLIIWSSIIMVIFGIIYVYQVFNMKLSVDLSLKENIISFIQYFLLGTSGIYILANLYMVFGFLPGKKESSEDYRIRKIELKYLHISRFKDDQLSIYTTLFILFFAGFTFYLNYEFDYLPSHTLIWLMFTLFPIIIYFWEINNPFQSSEN